MKLPKLLTVSDGPAQSPLTNSGVALGITAALARSGRVDLVQTVDARPQGLTRALLAITTLRPNRDWWWATFNLGPLNIRVRSAIRERAIRRSDRSGRIDLVVHIRNIYLPASKPYVAFIDSTSMMANQGWSPWRPKTRLALNRRLAMERAYYQGAIRVVTAGETAADSVVKDYGVPPERVEAIGGGVNFTPLPILQERPRNRTILWVGLDYERKGGDVLIGAFRIVRERFPDAKLIMVGSGPSGMEPGVEALGVIRDREALADLYRKAFVFCLPARHEPYGLVVQEAMAFALPCVVSATGSLPSIVNDGVCGHVVPVLGEEQLAEALIKVFEDPARAAELGKAGRHKVEAHLTWDAVAGRLLDGILDEKATQS